jgi:S-adenosylmethionine:tRNA ribosyltransferase-isomerase
VIAARKPIQRPAGARLLVVGASGGIAHAPRSRFVDFLRPGDLVVANDAATLPASLHGVHLPGGGTIEVRLAARGSLSPADVRFTGVVFGAGDFRTRTEDRPPPPLLERGDRVILTAGARGSGTAVRAAAECLLSATVDSLLEHPRLVTLRFEGTAPDVWAGIARCGRPIQYAHIPVPLALWDVWTPIAALPVAFEPPSAGFTLDWQSIHAMRARRIEFATVTLAAGISSTGDAELDRRLPFDEPYRIPRATADAIRRTRARGGRLVAVGTTVVRALEHAGARDGLVQAGDGVANQRLGPASPPGIVDAILSGTHEPGTSHYELLRAFVDDRTLEDAAAALESSGYLTHEFGDSILIERRDRQPVSLAASPHPSAEPQAARGPATRDTSHNPAGTGAIRGRLEAGRSSPAADPRAADDASRDRGRSRRDAGVSRRAAA